jgi:hypothetical protein
MLLVQLARRPQVPLVRLAQQERQAPQGPKPPALLGSRQPEQLVLQGPALPWQAQPLALLPSALRLGRRRGASLLPEEQ